MTTILITGANGGLGRSLVRSYADDGLTVLAIARASEPVDELEQIASAAAGTVEIEAVELTDRSSIRALRNRIGERPIDIFLNNAGANGGTEAMMSEFGSLDFECWEDVYATNVVAPIMLAQVFLPNLLAGADKKLVMISSTISTIIMPFGAPGYAYRSSRAALNFIARQLACDLTPCGIAVGLVCPGWVKTGGQGGPDAPVELDDSVAGIRRAIDDLDFEHTGGFRSHTGSWVLPFEPVPYR